MRCELRTRAAPGQPDMNEEALFSYDKKTCFDIEVALERFFMCLLLLAQNGNLN